MLVKPDEKSNQALPSQLLLATLQFLSTSEHDNHGKQGRVLIAVCYRCQAVPPGHHIAPGSAAASHAGCGVHEKTDVAR